MAQQSEATPLLRLILVVGITVLSGWADAQGFIYAAKIWQDGKVVLDELGKSALGFSVGIATYWLALKCMKGFGVISPEIQTVISFGVAIIGVALASGKFFKWPIMEQAVAVIVLVGIGWLLFRTGG